MVSCTTLLLFCIDLRQRQPGSGNQKGSSHKCQQTKGTLYPSVLFDLKKYTQMWDLLPTCVLARGPDES